MAVRLRAGRKVRRNLYLQVGPEPDDRDLPVGTMSDEHVARLVVEAWNAAYEDDV